MPTSATVSVDDDLSSAISGARTVMAPTSEPTRPQTAPTDPPVTENDNLAEALTVLAAAEPLEGFEEGLLRVYGSDGESVWPIIVASTATARQRGLMGITEFGSLGGYAAMVFVFDSDTSGAFWMRGTPLPLRITFVAADGEVVSGTDMVPCLAPTPSDECERYFAAAPYRYAIEHPLGTAFDIGLPSASYVEMTIG